MKRISLIIFSIILIFTFSACSKKNAEETNTTANGAAAQTEQNSPKKEAATSETKASDTTIEIVPPDGWTLNENSVLPVHYMKGTTSFMVKPEPYQSKDLDGVVSEAKKIFSDTFDDVKFEVESQELTIDGKEARKMIFTCKVSSMNMKYEYDFLFVNEKVYVITFGGASDSFDSLSSDYEQIIKDIHFK